jgi:hypothetical protein
MTPRRSEEELRDITGEEHRSGSLVYEISPRPSALFGFWAASTVTILAAIIRLAGISTDTLPSHSDSRPRPADRRCAPSNQYSLMREIARFCHARQRVRPFCLTCPK